MRAMGPLARLPVIACLACAARAHELGPGWPEGVSGIITVEAEVPPP